MTGNITNHTAVGSFAYENTEKPYAVTAVTPYGTAIPLRDQDISYNGMQRPDTIIENGYRSTFTYNDDGNRVKMHLTHNSATQLTRYYIGGQYELDSETGTERLYLGGDAYSASSVYVKEAGNWKIYYICRDYLGSITHVVDADGSLKQELSYDPWGRLRNPATQQIYASGSEPILFLGRGYTGHEHLTVFGLINMNARLYDPVLSRFLSPDPYVQEIDFSQNFNRYSYCLNNPLRYTDPSGESFLRWLYSSDTGYELQKYFSFVAIRIRRVQGSERDFISIDISFGIPQILPISYRYHAGAAYYWKDYDNMYSGWETNHGGEWGALGFVTFSTTNYNRKGTEYDQSRDVWKLGNPLINFQIENDANMNKLNLPWLPEHEASDKHLSSEIRLRFGNVEIGLTTVTGRGVEVDKETNTYIEADGKDYRAGILYLKIGSIKIGYDSEAIRDITQNKLHEMFGWPTFKINSKKKSHWIWEIAF